MVPAAAEFVAVDKNYGTRSKEMAASKDMPAHSIEENLIGIDMQLIEVTVRAELLSAAITRAKVPRDTATPREGGCRAPTS